MTSQQPAGRLKQLLEDLQLIYCSLLPDEQLIFTEDHDYWLQALSDPENLQDVPDGGRLQTFEVRIEGGSIWFEMTVTGEYPSVSLRGEDISRSDQDRWRALVAKVQASIDKENQYAQSTGMSCPLP